MSVALISSVGLAVNNLILSYPKKLYEERINALEALVIKLDSHIGNLRQYRNELPNFWEGEDADKYSAILQIKLNSLDNYRQIVNDDIAMYKKFIADLSSTQTFTGGIMDDALGMMSSLESKLSAKIDGSGGGGFR